MSSGLAPTAQEGTAQYTKQLQNAVAVQGILAKTAVATGTDIDQMGKSYVLAAHNLGLPLDSIDTANQVMDLFGITLDKGIGTMGEYTNQFVKFGAAAKAAGVSSKESFSLFALLTQGANPNKAGFLTSSLIQEYVAPITSARRFSNAINLNEANMTPAQRAILGQYGSSTPRKASNAALSLFENTSTGKTLDILESLKKINDIYQKVNKVGGGGTFLASISGGNRNVQQAYQELLTSNGSGLKELLDMQDQFQGNWQKKREIIHANIGTQW